MSPGSVRRTQVAVVGARGYSGLELCRLLLRHPYAELSACFASEAGWRLSDYLPEEAAKAVPVLPLSALFETAAPGVVFLATPNEVSADLAPKLLERGAEVIDLSGAFRLDSKDYSLWYGFEHPHPELLPSAAYGLVPWSNLTGRLTANPGCYATSVLMALLPLLLENLIEPSSIVIDAKSGTSGAGRKAEESLLFTEVDGECLPYKVSAHQHLPEIRKFVREFAKIEIDPFFTTHLISARRGILSSIYATLSAGATGEAIEGAFSKHYSDYPFVQVARIQGKKTPNLSLKRVAGSNRTQISYRTEGRKLYLFSVIDNLVKGAAGQAIENFNRLRDLPVVTGIKEQEGLL